MKKREKKPNPAIERYEKAQQEEKARIKEEPSKWKRFWKYVWHLASWPFKWLWAQCHDWRFLLLFVIVMVVVSSEVWIFYLLAFISWGSDFSKWALGIGSTMWAFWLLPGTPFIPLCIAITIGLQAIIDKVKYRKGKEKDHGRGSKDGRNDSDTSGNADTIGSGD